MQNDEEISPPSNASGVDYTCCHDRTLVRPTTPQTPPTETHSRSIARWSVPNPRGGDEWSSLGIEPLNQMLHPSGGQKLRETRGADGPVA